MRNTLYFCQAKVRCLGVSAAFVAVAVLQTSVAQAISPLVRDLQERVEALEQAAKPPSVVDSQGQVVGTILRDASGSQTFSRPEDPLFEVVVLVQIGGIPTLLVVTPTEITGFTPKNHGLTFDEEDCEGNPFMVTRLSTVTFGSRAVLFNGHLYIATSEPRVETSFQSRVTFNATTGVSSCENDAFFTFHAEAIKVPLSIFDGFVGPFSITGLQTIP